MRQCLISKTDSFKANVKHYKKRSNEGLARKLRDMDRVRKKVSFTVSDSLQGGPPVISWFVNPNLVGGWAYPSEKYEFVSWGYYSQDMEKYKMFQTTNQV